jgi:murein DD-endopeptidase MepM/ murein hydrolase activator NlpD
MSIPVGSRCALASSVLLSLALAGSAQAAHSRTGGAAMPERPVVENLRCADGQAFVCEQGERLTVAGERLKEARSVVFLGGRGRADDRGAPAQKPREHRLIVTVPPDANPGPVRVLARSPVARHASRSAPSRPLQIKPAAGETDPAAGPQVLIDGQAPAVFRYRATDAAAAVELVRGADGAVVQRWPAQVDAAGNGEVRWDGRIDGADAPAGRYAFRTAGGAQPVVAPDTTPSEFTLLDHIFPIRGKHDLGQSDTNNFGGGRGHKGQDMFARCGTPIVAARGGRVKFAGFEGRAGNYAVITRDDGQSYVYMHMRRAPLVKTGQTVFTGQPVGEVGETGRASGCHLHFELWTPPGWYEGGEAIDPLPELQRWDALS